MSKDTTDILGKGVSGVVYKGIIDGRPVAAKTIRKPTDIHYLKALLSELKIMIYLEFHENVIQLIGAYTKDIQKGTLMCIDI
jgi:FMS-like tyrosine kinase 1